jgi:hypothetical protein
MLDFVFVFRAVLYQQMTFRRLLLTFFKGPSFVPVVELLAVSCVVVEFLAVSCAVVVVVQQYFQFE